MTAGEFARRRRRLMRMMGEGAIAIVPTAPVRIRNRDIAYPFRPDSDFWYLTGFPEPEAVAVLVPGRKQGEYILFCRERDPEQEVWHGRRVGLEGAVERYGADDAFPIGDIDDILPGLLEDRERVYYAMGRDAEFDRRVMEWVNRVRAKSRTGVHAPVEFVALEHVLHELRLFKSRAEVAAIRRAVRITEAAHRRAMAACRPGVTEYQLEAEIVHEFMRHGARQPAYPAIVGAGANACILHYTDNSATVEAGDLVLIDAGAEWDGYAADLTRTFPADGRFRPAQRAIYELVLEAQQAAIEAVRPGASWDAPHRAAVRVATRGLVRLGLLEGRLARLLREEAYKRFCLHRTGHWLGLDVHDVGDYKVDGAWRSLEPGMVLTIEPGIYIAPRSRGVSRRWWGIGVRIEDDVLVTRDGREVLSASLPKDPEEVAALVGG